MEKTNRLTQSQLRTLLLDNPGYRKKSPNYLSNRYGISPLICQGILNAVKQELLADIKSIPPFLRGNKNNVLVIGDLHEPFTLGTYLGFCRKVQEIFNCGTVQFIGDMVDNHFTSYHEIDPDAFGAGQELEFARYKIAKWHKTFPDALVCRGNHDLIIARKAYSAGISTSWVRTESEVLGTDTWQWDDEFFHKGVQYVHGTGYSGHSAALTMARERGHSVVMGHLHTISSVQYLSRKNPTFGMIVGCGIDASKYAFKYAKYFSRKPIISCGVVLNGKQAFNIYYEEDIGITINSTAPGRSK